MTETQHPRWVRAETALAVSAIAEAFELVRASAGAPEVRAKEARDVVTATDLAVEDALRARVAATEGLVVGEERGGAATGRVARFWLVDPICGTRNFAAGIPLYCVNLALVEDGVVAVAAVGEPTTGAIHFAERRRGAWSLAAGSATRLRAHGDSNVLVIDDSHAANARRAQAAAFTAAVINADRWDVRSLSTTLALPYVAAGRVAAYALFWTSAVHAAAGSLLAAEAGAVVSDLAGAPWTIDSDSILTSATGELHRHLLQIAKDARRPKENST